MAHRLFVLHAILAAPIGLALAQVLPAWAVGVALLSLSLLLYGLHRQGLEQILRVGRYARAEAQGRTNLPDSTPALGRLDPYGNIVETIRNLHDDYEEATFARIRANLRMMGLSEIWRALGQSSGLENIFEGLLSYCRQEAGFEEVALLRIDPRSEELSGSWAWSGPEGPQMAAVRWSLGGLGGGIRRALRSAHVVVNDDPERAEALITVNGERPQPRTAHRGYLIIPLLSPMTPPACLQEGWLYRDGCPQHQEHPVAATRARRPPDRRAFDLGACGSCRHYPILGLLVVTDLHREKGLQRGDRLLLEALASTVASVMDHAVLYREVKGAERFRDQIFDAMLNGLLSTDQHGRVVFANRRAREMGGWREGPLGRPLAELVELPGSSALNRTLVEGVPYLHAEARLLAESEDSTEIFRVPVRVNLTPYRSERGAMKGVVCVIEDLSSLRAMEEEIRHLDTLAAIGRFASSMAHEIRNPLGGIAAGIGFLRRSSSPGSEAEENLEVIDQEIERLDGIIRSLMAVARPREVVLGRCNLVELLQRALKGFAVLAEDEEIELRESIDLTDETAYLDRDMIHQVIVNLLKNAIESAPRRSVVEIRLTEAKLSIEPHDDAAALRLEIADRGPGVAAEDLDRLFEPFFSRKSEGTGLGLYVSHNFVQRHGGSLIAENRAAGGARFTVLLPRVPALMGGRHEAAHSGRR